MKSAAFVLKCTSEAKKGSVIERELTISKPTEAVEEKVKEEEEEEDSNPSNDESGDEKSSDADNNESHVSKNTQLNSM